MSDSHGLVGCPECLDSGQCSYCHGTGDLTGCGFCRNGECPACRERVEKPKPQEAHRAQEDQMPVTVTAFPHEARARIRAEFERRNLELPPAEGTTPSESDALLRDAERVISHQESDYKALTNTVEFMRDRVRAAIEPR